MANQVSTREILNRAMRLKRHRSATTPEYLLAAHLRALGYPLEVVLNITLRLQPKRPDMRDRDWNMLPHRVIRGHKVRKAVGWHQPK